MSDATRRIGLSLGADICWPICYEEIMKRLDLALPLGAETVRFQVERVSIEPFDLRQACSYDLVIDRLTHWYQTSREWIKKSILMDDLYVFNNPWSVQAMTKQSTYCAMMRLGLPIPETWMIPPKSYEPVADLDVTLHRYARLFDLADIGRAVGYPLFMKPYDGGGWVGVSRIDDETALREAYEKSGKLVMQLQNAVHPFDLFVRAVGLGPQLRVIKYDPTAALHERYRPDTGFVSDEDLSLLRDMTLTINAFFGWDFNSCEALRKDGVFYPIDFANPCPDSQVTSLHFHFPWIVKANVRWSVFCAATRRPMRKTLDWEPFFQAAGAEAPFRERLARYARIADEHFDTARFEEFCRTHLPQLDEVAWEFFGSPAAREAVVQKVQYLFPAHEVEQFTEHFWNLIQLWRNTEGKQEAEKAARLRPSLATGAAAVLLDSPQPTPAHRRGNGHARRADEVPTGVRRKDTAPKVRRKPVRGGDA